MTHKRNLYFPKRSSLVNGIIIALLGLMFVPLFVSAQSVYVNEFMALNNATITDVDGDYSDWIEIYNPGSATVNLNGWSLTDNREEPQKWLLPEIEIEANGYLVVFASGKNRSNPDQELHCNFKLSGSGEYFAFADSAGNPVTEFDPAFPEQQSDVSYGYFDGDYIATTHPTPGAENQLGEGQILGAPVFNHQHGFYSEPFEVTITTDLGSAQIYYTLDGSEPTESNGTLYSAPILVNSTTILRAVIIKSANLTSRINTVTYLFLNDVINQPNNPPGYPAEWGPYFEISGTAIGDYEMDPEITQNPDYADLMDDALLALPTMSIVTDIDNLFSHNTDPETGGIYIYTGPADEGGTELGEGWERAASVEYFDSAGTENFQIDCGLRIHGGHSRRPEKTPKHSFRIVFRSEYGASKLNYPFFKTNEVSSYNTLVLRAGYGNNWLNRISSRRDRAQYLRDTWAKDTQLDMGYHSAHGTFVHLYLNGIYWGIYNPTERIDKDYAVSYLGGNEEDYDIVKDYNQIAEGNAETWNAMMSIANGGLENNTNYQLIQGKNPDGSYNPNYIPYLDIINFIDYMIINFYSGNWDWDAHNWIAVRNRVNPGKGFRFFSWDSEQILEQLNENRLNTNNNNRPTQLFQRLRENPDFVRLFADRVNLHLFNGGALTPEVAADRWAQRANEIDLAIIAESARWGDYRRDVHQWYEEGPFDLYDKSDWLAEQDYLLTQYFPQRSDIFVDQLRQAGLFPNAEAPRFFINGNPTNRNVINPGDQLTMTVPSGTIYYTTDGSDPFVSEQDKEASEIVLLAEDTDKNVLVPVSDIGTGWRTNLDFDDSGWTLCSGAPGGIGYEISRGYENFITLDVLQEMRDGANPNTSCYVRSIFDINSADLQKVKSLSLNVRYDDGFVAYLNNVKIAEVLAPPNPTWNSASTSTHESTGLEPFDISQYINQLKEQDNLLAVHALNADSISTDFIISFELSGSDESISGGEISPGALEYAGPVTLNQSSYIKARNFQGGSWSALIGMIFTVPSEIYHLKLNEIHYHPLAEELIDDRSFEFVELMNIGASPLDLSEVQFVDGISYTFPNGTVIMPGELLVLAADQVNFTRRYGFFAFDEYTGNLANSGERISVTSAGGDTIISVTYDDALPWSELADGNGYSLVAINPAAEQDDPLNWQASQAINGSPGSDEKLDIKLGQQDSEIPTAFRLSQNYPNPFNPTTNIAYSIPRNVHVNIKIYNMLGQEVASLIHQKMSPGNYICRWNAQEISSGIYFYVMTAGNFRQIKKMVLVR